LEASDSAPRTEHDVDAKELENTVPPRTLLFRFRFPPKPDDVRTRLEEFPGSLQFRVHVASGAEAIVTDANEPGG